MGFVSWYEKNQKRMAALVLAVGVAVVALSLFNRWPQDTTFRFDLESDATELEIRYLMEGELVHGARMTGEPLSNRVTHTVELGPGNYLVEFDVQRKGSRRAFSQTVLLPQEGIIVLNGQNK